MNPPALPSVLSLSRITLLLALLGLFFDWCFWQHAPGISVGLFSLVTAFAMWVGAPDRTLDRSRIFILIALLLSAGQSALSTGFCNGLVLAALLAIWAGDLMVAPAPERWMRWLEMSLGLLKSPGRWWWLTQQWLNCRFLNPQSRRIGFGGLVSVVLPTAVLTGFFGLLLGSGNAVLAQSLKQWTDWLDHFLQLWAITVPRFSFWLFGGTWLLALLRPSFGRPARWQWWADLPWRAEPDAPLIAQWRAGAVLAALNILFAVNNTLDIIYLWDHHQLPPGVTLSTYVHEGVHALIAAVLVSALVLAWIFQGSPRVTRSPLLRLLGLFWIAQNTVLIAGVIRRLALYIESYQFTTARVYVVFFLVLVSAGFAFLAVKIACEKSLGWLFGRNLCAVGALFFVAQFLDVEGWVADKNVDLWSRNQTRELDVWYLGRLGPTAWPALKRLEEFPSMKTRASEVLNNAVRKEEDRQSNRAGPAWQGNVARFCPSNFSPVP